MLDFADEGDVGEALPAGWRDDLDGACAAISATLLARPPAERLRDGVRVVLAGPPNAGKSSLLNALAGREAAITSAIPGTTRDLIEAPTAIGGMPFLLIDTAGLRDSGDDDRSDRRRRARSTASDAADLILWLGAPDACPDRGRARSWSSPKADLRRRAETGRSICHVSAVTGEGMDALIELLVERGRDSAARARARSRSTRVSASCSARALRICADAAEATDPADRSPKSCARRARRSTGSTGRAGVEDMLDALFGRFCIGK